MRTPFLRLALFTLFACILQQASFAQDQCVCQDSSIWKNGVLLDKYKQTGLDGYLKHGRDTMVRSFQKDSILYSCFECRMMLKDANGKIKWKRKLSKWDCQIYSFWYSVELEMISFTFKGKGKYYIQLKNGKFVSDAKMLRIAKRADRKKMKSSDPYQLLISS